MDRFLFDTPRSSLDSYGRFMSELATGQQQATDPGLGGAMSALQGLFEGLSKDLKRLSYNNLGDLIQGAARANTLSPMLTEEKRQGDKLRGDVERLLGTIRMKDACILELQEQLRTKTRTLELVVGQRDALDRQNDKLRDSNVELQNELFTARKRVMDKELAPQEPSSSMEKITIHNVKQGHALHVLNVLNELGVPTNQYLPITLVAPMGTWSKLAPHLSSSTLTWV